MSARITTGLAGGVAVFLALGLLSQTLYNTAHNEQMYVAAAYLTSEGQQLYRDFAFVQMPYSPWLYAAVYSLTGGSDYLLKAKLVTFVLTALAASALYSRAARSTRDRGLALLLVAIFLANYYVLRATIEASNYTLPIAASLLAAVWLLRGLEGERRAGWWSFAAGLALAAAVGAKLYYATLLAPFGLAALLYPRTVPWPLRVRRGALPLAAGVGVGLLPAAWVALRDPELFRWNNLGYHLLNTQWRAQNGFTDMGWGAKLETARDLATNPNLAPLALWLALAGLLWWNRRAGWAWPRPGVLLAGMAAGVALLTAFTPRPLFPQYFAMPIPFLLLWVGELYAARDVGERRLLRQLGLVVMVIALLAVLPRHTGSLRRWAAGEERWSGIEAAATSRAIHAHLDARGRLAGDAPPRVATLSPVLALEAHLPFYPELATGSFVYRVGDLLTAEERARFVATSPSTLPALLDAQPPTAIFIGGEGELELPLLEYAESRGYTRIEPDFVQGQLYVR